MLLKSSTSLQERYVLLFHLISQEVTIFSSRLAKTVQVKSCSIEHKEFAFIEPRPSSGQCRHQQWTPWRFYPYWACRYCQKTGRWCGSPSTCQPGTWSKKNFFSSIFPFVLVSVALNFHAMIMGHINGEIANIYRFLTSNCCNIFDISGYLAFVHWCPWICFP